MDLLVTEIRVLGALVEKQRTTPDAYPLTLNSLRLACNQSTNRDPVVSYEESDVRDALHRLERRGFVRFASGAGSRAAKFRHLLAERLPMDDGEQALMCVLMLRGGQTPGELKQRAERLHPFAGLDEVHETLSRLIERDLVMRLPRRPGQKEERYAQLLGGNAEEASGEGREGPEADESREGPEADEGREGREADEGREGPEADEGREGRETDAPMAGAEAVGPHTETAPARDAGLRALAERVDRLEAELESLKAELGVGATP